MGSFRAALIAGYSAPSSDPTRAMIAAFTSQLEVISTGSVWKLAPQASSRAVADRDAQDHAANRDQQRLAQHYIHDVELARAQRLQDADLARALHHRRVHGLEDHDEADDHRNADHDVDDGRQPGNAGRGHQAQVLLQRVHAVLLHAGNVLDLAPRRRRCWDCRVLT